MSKRPASAMANNSRDNKKRRPPVPSASKKKREIVFDPEARKAHLRGFSERKRQRRAYGLAMQKVKDRNAKLEERMQNKKDELKRVQEAEQQKAAYFEEMRLRKKGVENENNEDEDCGKDIEGSGYDSEEASKEKAVLASKTYDDVGTETHWGGRVTVTTAVVDLSEGESSDEDDGSGGRACNLSKKNKSVDKQQQYAGNVERYITRLKGKMPGKKKSKDATGHQTKRKGKNGASEMKGVGGAANLKLAQKVLSKAKATKGPSSAKGKRLNGKKKSRR